jgi:cell division protein FtsQ
MFTPLMAIEKISVTGNQKVPSQQILANLKHRIGSPLPMLTESDVAKDLEKFRLIESISLVSQPPNKLQVRITERTAISIVVRGSTRYLYDPAGVNLGRANGNEALPVILVNDDPKTSELLKRVAYIQAKSRDNVTMQLRGLASQTIIWGDATDSILKSRVLKALLLKTPANIRATFDVSAPLTPSVIR